MKKVFFLMVISSLLSVQHAFADKKIYTTDTLQLPVVARQFIAKHFAGVGVSHIKIEKEFWEGNQYDVILTNGFELDFNDKGEWKEIDGQRVAVPESVLPVKIQEYVQQNFPGISVISIEKERDGFDIKLSDKRELKFNKSQKFVRFDD